jgi:2-methylcitrate dehydratase PrpD
VYRYVRAQGGREEATVTYHGDRLSAPYAAYANSVFSYSCELQHHGTFGSAHTGVVVVPTVQALGEQLGSSGREIVAAMVAGYEVQGRLGAALFKPVFKRHFHPQGVFGVFSAAAAAGKLLGLNEEQQTHAFAIAGSHASTILEYDQAGGEVKRVHGAIALRGGIQAACMAKEGLTGPLTVFEGQRGIFASFGGGEADPESLFSGIGRPYCITQCRFRIYPTIGSCHNALDIVNDLIGEHRFDYRDVEKIRVGMRELSVMHVTSISRPHDVISAQASLGYSLAGRGNIVRGRQARALYPGRRGTAAHDAG